MSTLSRPFAAVLLATAPLAGNALEYPISVPKNIAGMEIAAVYLQPIDMEPAGHMKPAAESDIHLEADIHALDSNANGFPEGAWIPGLLVRYELTNLSTGAVHQGDMMAMVASDGPHYGDNVALSGIGKYRLRFRIFPPNAPESADRVHFGRHTDRATGVRPWFRAFETEWEFTYAGTGKKGGY